MARKSNLLPNSVHSFDSSKHLIRQDIQVTDDMLIINIKCSKTRQFGRSRQVPIVVMPNYCLCPVTAYKNMISKIAARDSVPAFCFHSSHKKKSLVPITYAMFQTKFRDLILAEMKIYSQAT